MNLRRNVLVVILVIIVLICFGSFGIERKNLRASLEEIKTLVSLNVIDGTNVSSNDTTIIITNTSNGDIGTSTVSNSINKKKEFTLEDFLLDPPPSSSSSYPYPSTPRRSQCPPFPDNTTLNISIPKFNRYEGVILVTKIHDSSNLKELEQCVCLLQAAYNHQPLYDYLIFHTENITQEQQLRVNSIVHPANVTWAQDTQPLQDVLAGLPPATLDTLFRRCNQPGASGINTTQELTWRHRCTDGRFNMPLAYNWMAEFRSKWIWRRPELADYKYMLWFDTDSFATMAWREDPIEYMVQNKMALLMGDYGLHSTPVASGVKYRIRNAYNTTICKVSINDTRFTTILDSNITSPCLEFGNVEHVHGFFHITDLDFYRLPVNRLWADEVIGHDGIYQRIWDDQLAVVVPPAVLAPHRMATLDQIGVCPLLLHNLQVMDHHEARAFTTGYRGFKAYWRIHGEEYFPEGYGKCKDYVQIGHRRRRS